MRRRAAVWCALLLLAGGTVAVGIAAAATFEIEGFGHSGPIQEGETLQVGAEIVNNGSSSDTQNVTLNTQLGADQQTVQLGPGNSTSVEFALPTSDGDAGEYAAAIVPENGPEAEFSFTVESADSGGGGVGNVTIDPGEITNPSVVNISASVDGKNLTIDIGTHPDENVTQLNITAFEQGNETNEFVNESYSSDASRTITRQNTSIKNASTLVVRAALSTSDRDDPIVRTIFLGELRDLDVPLQNSTLQVLSLLSIVMVAGLFGGSLSSVGGVVVVGLAWVLSAIGWLSISPLFLTAAGVIALFLAAASSTGGIR